MWDFETIIEILFLMRNCYQISFREKSVKNENFFVITIIMEKHPLIGSMSNDFQNLIDSAYCEDILIYTYKTAANYIGTAQDHAELSTPTGHLGKRQGIDRCGAVTACFAG